MSVVLDEHESFNLTAYVTSPGYQNVALHGYITQQRGDGLYAAPLIPDLFYGASGSALSGTWRQFLPATGSTTILSRSGGQPSVPREDLYWRKVSSNEPSNMGISQPTQPPLPIPARLEYPSWLIPGIVVGASILGFYVLLKLAKKK